MLTQQLVAEAASQEWQEDELFQRFTRAAPYRELTRARFRETLTMLTQGFSTRRGRRSRHIHYDAINKRIRPRKGARLTAATNGGVTTCLTEANPATRREADNLLARRGNPAGFIDAPSDDASRLTLKKS